MIPEQEKAAAEPQKLSFKLRIVFQAKVESLFDVEHSQKPLLGRLRCGKFGRSDLDEPWFPQNEAP